MLRLAGRELLSRPMATLLVCVGLLTATLGFTVGASTSRATEAQLLGDVTRAWSGPYQLLVRPIDSVTASEIATGRVRPNYLGGLTGGITLAQLAQIRAHPSVAIAAPIAIVGFVRWPTGIKVVLPFRQDDLEALRITARATGDAGLSHYPIGLPAYGVYARNGVVDTLGSQLQVGSTTLYCERIQGVQCFAERYTIPSVNVDKSPTVPTIALDFAQPILLAGIDPEAEAALVGLDRCVSTGRMLQDADRPVLNPLPNSSDSQTVIPILISEKSFIDETVEVTVERASDPAPMLSGSLVQKLDKWEPVQRTTLAGDDIYRNYLTTISTTRFYNPSPLWSPADVSYEELGSEHLRALPVAEDPAIFANQLIAGASAADLRPIEATDVWMRAVNVRAQLKRAEPPNSWISVGRFRPDCLAGFDPLVGGRLDAYTSPLVTLPDGRALGPTRSIAGYVNAPPLLLTTLTGAQWFADPSRFEGAAGDAFVSAIRVRLSGVDAYSEAAQARVAQAAADIREQTGLAVDVVIGSSTRPIQVDLPEGRYGRPALTVTEPWSVKGVVVRFVEAISAQNVALFALMLPAAIVLVGETAFVNVRRRRREFGALRALGWSPRHIATLVLAEMLMLGGAVTVASTLAALAMAAVVPGVGISQIALIGPLALAVALAGAIAPALSAARAAPLRSLHPHQSITGWRVSLRGPATLGLRDVFGAWRVEALSAALAVALGATLFGVVVLIATAFAGRLDVTVLGTYVTGQVRPFHVALAVLALLVGALAAGQVVTLGYLERAEDLAALRALGWTRATITRYLATQAIALSAAGAMLASLVVLMVGILMRAPAHALFVAVGAALAAALIAALVAAAAPIATAYRRAPGELLRGE